MVWQSLQLCFSKTRLPATTLASSLSACVNAANDRCVSQVSASRTASDVSVPTQKTSLAARSLMGFLLDSGFDFGPGGGSKTPAAAKPADSRGLARPGGRPHRRVGRAHRHLGCWMQGAVTIC